MSPNIKIGTWNVEYAYAKRLQDIRSTIDQHDVDIWVLTETHDDLRPANCSHAIHSAPRPKNWNGIRPGSRWVSIWSKFPIVPVDAIKTVDADRTVAALLVLGASHRLLVYGTVMPWKQDGAKEGIKNWVKHHRVIPEQCAEWAKLLREHQDVPLCVAGDFNTDLGTGSYYGTRTGIDLLKAGLADCGLFCATAPDHMPSGLLPEPPIDHIALPRKWSASTRVANVIPRRKGILSDHSGVIVEVTLANLETVN